MHKQSISSSRPSSHSTVLLLCFRVRFCRGHWDQPHSKGSSVHEAVTSLHTHSHTLTYIYTRASFTLAAREYREIRCQSDSRTTPSSIPDFLIQPRAHLRALPLPTYSGLVPLISFHQPDHANSVSACRPRPPTAASTAAQMG